MKQYILPAFIGCILSLCLYAKSPEWKAIYSNDTTNIFNCHSPFNPQGDDTLFDEKMLRASVKEAAVNGMGAQLLQPGHGWVAWWPSKIVPLAEHEQWFRETFGNEPSVATQKYLLKGGDLLGAFIDECHKNGNAALISYRLNDAHHLEWHVKGNAPGYTAHAVNKFYADHPEYRMAPPPATDGFSRIHNWEHKGARDYKLALIREITELYPQLDGFELDTMRYPAFFPETTPDPKRQEIMLDFIGQVRQMLDKLEAKDGKHRYLGARIPMQPDQWRKIGLDPALWEKAGVEFFNISPSYEMSEQTGIAELRKAVPNARIYSELTHTTQRWRWRSDGGYDSHNWRRSTKEMLENTARISYARGADGVSFFNFAYYRGHGDFQDLKGPFNEPPFEYIPALTDAKALENIDGYFYIDGRHKKLCAGDEASVFEMDIVPAKGNPEGIVRFQVLTEEERRRADKEKADAIDRGKWIVTVNGHPLEQAAPLDKAYLFSTPIKTGFGQPEQYIGFKLPKGLLIDGKNTVKIKHLSGPPLYLRWVEIVQPESSK